MTGLINGQSYEFQVRAVNGEVPGSWSDEATATPRTVPGAATGLRATPADGEAVLAWTAPAETGGSAITGYEVRYILSSGDKNAVATWTTPTDAGAGTTYTVTGLTNGQSYEFEVRAVNAAGDGAWSVPTTTTPRTTPGAPTGLGATPGNGEAALAWTAPTDTGGSAITGYDVRYILSSATDRRDGQWTDSSHSGTDTTHTVTGLTNGETWKS